MDDGMMKDQEVRVELQDLVIEPQLALKTATNVVDKAKKSHSTWHLRPLMALMLFTAACVDVGVPSSTPPEQPTMTATTTATVTARPTERAAITPTKTPTAAPVSGEVIKPSGIKDETWNQLSKEQKIALAKEIGEKTTADNRRKDQAFRDKIAQENTRAAAEAATKDAEIEFNTDINKGKTTINSPGDVPEAGLKIGGDILTTLGKLVLLGGGIVAVMIGTSILIKLPGVIIKNLWRKFRGQENGNSERLH